MQTLDFAIKLRENIYVEEDKTKRCVNYPYSRYETYNDCDKDFLASAAPPGFVPIWSTNNSSKVTEIMYMEDNIREDKNSSLYEYMALCDGTMISLCPLPCSTHGIPIDRIRCTRAATTT